MKQKIICLIVIGLVLAIAYCLTLAPGLSWANGGADGGDLITAAAVKGIPHPTGYPLYLLAAGFFQKFIPIGDLAFRTNLLSALCTIIAALLIFLTVTLMVPEQGDSRSAGLIAALSFGLAPLIWSQAVISEVYALQSLLTISIILLTLSNGGHPQEDFLRGLFVGLAMSNHSTSIFLLPTLLIDGPRLRISRPLKLLSRIFGMIAGLTVYLILPFRAVHQPPINWFNPVNFENFWKLVTGSIYQSYFSFAYTLPRLRVWADYLIKNFSFLGVATGLFSLFEFRKKLVMNVVITWIFFGYGLFSLFYASNDSHIYLIQSFLAFSLWIGMGFAQLLSIWKAKWKKAGLAMLMIMLFSFAFRIPNTISQVDASRDHRAVAFSEEFFSMAPEGSLVFTGDDQTTFALWYYQYALGQRKDAILIAEGLIQFDWYRDSLRINYPDIQIREDPKLSIFNIMQDNPLHPVCFVDYVDVMEVNCSQRKNV